MVDFGVYLDPRAMDDPDAVRAIDDLRTKQPELVINHTPLEPLMDKPLWLCAETKKPGEGLEAGKLQISAWLAAQWNLLESMIAARAPDAKAAESCMDALPFLPAILIQGHDWNFVAATRNGPTIVSTTTDVFSGLSAHALRNRKSRANRPPAPAPLEQAAFWLNQQPTWNIADYDGPLPSSGLGLGNLLALVSSRRVGTRSALLDTRQRVKKKLPVLQP
jgi:hypothetical protein